MSGTNWKKESLDPHKLPLRVVSNSAAKTGVIHLEVWYVSLRAGWRTTWIDGMRSQYDLL